MVHLYCGDGKGKTTAAAGLAIRAAGNGYRVLFAQFMKGTGSGEVKVLRAVDGIEVMRAEGQEKFTFRMDAQERLEAAAENQALLDRVSGTVRGTDDIFLTVLDEAVTAVERGMLEEEGLKAFIEENRDRSEIVMTGSIPEKWMVEAADYVTDMQKIRHPFDSGISARRGIEF